MSPVKGHESKSCEMPGSIASLFLKFKFAKMKGHSKQLNLKSKTHLNVILSIAQIFYKSE